MPALDIAPNDPAIAYFQSAGNVVDIDQLELDSPAIRTMKEAGVRMVVPLVSQGELIGLLNLGPRMSQQEYSADDRTLLNNLAAQATPAVRVAQLVRQQQAEAQERERIEQELQVARLIQHTLLPKELPALDGWQVAAYYQPAREVGGDFYDFIDLSDGRLGLVVGDVTDKGVPAALVMATTRSVMRAAASRLDSPGSVLQRVNDLLCPDIPANMFVTCLYAILEPSTGRLIYANAGHDLPYRRSGNGATELRATGMPLGLLSGMEYEEREITLEMGDSVVFYSDGLVEAHDAQRGMFGFPRLRSLMATYPQGDAGALVDFLLAQLASFTGPHWEQEDDITLVTLQRSNPESGETEESMHTLPTLIDNGWELLSDFSVPSEQGNERLAMRQVTEVIQPLGLPPRSLDQLKTAVAEATMNAMEHGNKYQAEVPVLLQVLRSDASVLVRISDQGDPAPADAPEAPNLEAKLDNRQTPRGWGLFLIHNMVDEMNVTNDANGHTIELVMHLKGDDHAG